MGAFIRMDPAKIYHTSPRDRRGIAMTAFDLGGVLQPCHSFSGDNARIVRYAGAVQPESPSSWPRRWRRCADECGNKPRQKGNRAERAIRHFLMQRRELSEKPGNPD